ncbi:MAG: hypothetical protein FWG05_05430, partial [Kiritimatiellaeota bacterium]|nr:hypothetical protein [Kiritimatiellota bacterium]
YSISNRIEVLNGGRIIVPTTATRFSVCENGSNSWGNAAIFTQGGILETKALAVNGSGSNAPKGPVWDNVISFEDSVLLFNVQEPVIDITSNGVVSLKNSSVGFCGFQAAYVKHGKFALLSFIGDTAFRLSDAATSNGYNQEYHFEKGLGADHFYRLELMDGVTHYRSNSDAQHKLTFADSGELYCSNTTAVVSLATTIDGSLTVFDSTVLFERGLKLNGVLRLNADAVKYGNTVLEIDGDLELGEYSEIEIAGYSQDELHIKCTGALKGRFAEKSYENGANRSVAYYPSEGLIVIKDAPPATVLIVK